MKTYFRDFASIAERDAWWQEHDVVQAATCMTVPGFYKLRGTRRARVFITKVWLILTDRDFMPDGFKPEPEP